MDQAGGNPSLPCSCRAARPELFPAALASTLVNYAMLLAGL